jgi:60 kDa SS-A/Ro ribonucleoprotein
MVRMNLNSFQRHGVFKQPKMVNKLARRLTDVESIHKARAFPYQLLTAYQSASGVPDEIRRALEQAMEIALTNVPELPGRVVVCPDVSGSMHWPATGWRRGSTSATRCIDVAALVAAAFLRKDRRTLVWCLQGALECGCDGNGKRHPAGIYRWWWDQLQLAAALAEQAPGASRSGSAGVG